MNNCDAGTHHKHRFNNQPASHPGHQTTRTRACAWLGSSSALLAQHAPVPWARAHNQIEEFIPLAATPTNRSMRVTSTSRAVDFARRSSWLARLLMPLLLSCRH